MKLTDMPQVRKTEQKYPLVMAGDIFEIDTKSQPCCSDCKDSVEYIIAVMQHCIPEIKKAVDKI